LLRLRIISSKLRYDLRGGCKLWAMNTGHAIRLPPDPTELQ
jgi:hypothetical protein